MHSRTTRLSLLALSTIALPVAGLAGVKYWSNPAFKAYDADAYVQDGLVLNYDGIRNVGLDQEHSYDTTTWVNLGSGGSANNATAWSRNTSNTSTSWTKNSILYGEWTDSGFSFNQRSRWEIPGSFSLDQFTVQLVTDITRANAQDSSGRMYAVFGNGNNSNSQAAWKTLGVATLKSVGYGNGMYFPMDNWGYSKRPSIPDATVKYFTGAQDTSAAYAVSGTDLSAATTANYGYISGRTVSGPVSFTGICLGSNGNGSQSLTGTIKNFRLYPNRVLSTDELIWNRAVDETRFFGAAPLMEIPVTNVVVASAGGNEPIGNYAVDASGHAFTAPATRIDDGLEYALDGYAVETWDSATGTWGEPVDYQGASYSATDSGKVRLTWKWHATTGLLTRWNDAAHDIGDYVQDGLVLHFDGIRNVGADAPHDDAAVVWKNIAPGGGYDLLAYHYTGSGRAYGFADADTNSYWTADGFHFSGAHPVCDFFFHAGTITVPATYTMQILVDANTIDQKNGGTVTYPVCFNPWNLSTVGIRRKEDDANNTHSFYLAADVMLGDIGSQRPRDSNLFCLDYGTAILDVIETENGEVGGATFFTGTTIESKDKLYRPTMWAANGWQTGVVAKATSSSGFAFGGMVGGQSGNGAQAFNGKIKSFRLYDRPLTEAQLSQNRIVDEARFFGGPSVTNVEVATTFSFLQGAEDAGAYGVRGAYTFTCPETSATVRGVEYALDGYTIETLDATYGWNSATATAYTGNSYTYTEGESPEKVRLTWRWKPVRGIRTASDYTVEDCVANGLDLHYDGICNVGKDSPHDGLTRVWRNLARSGDHDLKYGAGTISWNSDGHAFNGSTYFTAPVFTFPFRDTFQSLLDADPTSQPASDGIAYWFFPSGNIVANNDAWQRVGALSVRTSWKGVEYAGHGHQADKRPHNLYDAAGKRYASDVPVTWVNAAKDETRIFVTPAATNVYGTTQNSGAMQYTAVANAGPSAVPFYIGGPSSGQRLRGTVKNFRHYDRVLTDAEFQRNRQVDSARFFGVLATTNLVVEADGFEASPAAGEYFVEGSYDFSVAAVEGGATPTGYKLQDWDEANAVWTNTRYFEGTSCTFAVADATAAKTKLSWCETKPFMLIVR